MADNERGYHKPRQVNFDRGAGPSEGGSPPHGGAAHRPMAEPTNHGGVTHEMARTHEHNARVERHRAAHAGGGQRDHEKILHETHRLHQGDGFVSHGDKHGAASHWRREAERGDTAAHERTESAAERKREGE